MSQRANAFEMAYPNLLAAIWDELEDLLDAHYGSLRHGGSDADRLRLKLQDLRSTVSVMLRYRANDGHADDEVRLDALANELLRLLDAQLAEDEIELSCGATLVLAQNRILDEARRVAHAERSDGDGRHYG